MTRDKIESMKAALRSHIHTIIAPLSPQEGAEADALFADGFNTLEIANEMGVDESKIWNHRCAKDRVIALPSRQAR
jgi:DNA-directed RNA polymerase specialized sigma24 family protein